ncbi:hypothetical protein RclHR1_00800002 [Rhizophagus clarus]|uniref:Tyr recombinase domain-containing protein n=1 Tax=Rhizophagus clarus TaxID=94130 RepID=A0A2Z6SAS5_9GLOM|nr:hypothetical protein RclHR1_00800002 [Rhizophagus clarus]
MQSDFLAKYSIKAYKAIKTPKGERQLIVFFKRHSDMLFALIDNITYNWFRGDPLRNKPTRQADNKANGDSSSKTSFRNRPKGQNPTKNSKKNKSKGSTNDFNTLVDLLKMLIKNPKKLVWNMDLANYICALALCLAYRIINIYCIFKWDLGWDWEWDLGLEWEWDLGLEWEWDLGLGWDKNIEFFQNFSKVKNTEAATSNWIGQLENFQQSSQYEGKVEDICDKEELEQQLCAYIASMKKSNGKEYSVNSVLSGKVKFLTDLGHGEVKGADTFTDEEIQQILPHICMDGSTPARLLKRLFFFNACILGLCGSEHYLLNASSFKKRKDGGYDVIIYRSKTNQRGFISNKALQSGIWFKKAHVGYKRLNSFMNEIAKLSGVDVTDRKISNHSGRKMLIQGLQKLGISKEEIALQSRHKSLEGINAYTLHPEQQHYDMLNVFANKFQSTSQDSNSNTNAFKDQKEECFISSREIYIIAFVVNIIAVMVYIIANISDI